MGIFGFLKRTPKQDIQKELHQKVENYLRPTQEEVYKAIRKLTTNGGVTTARRIETHMHWRGGSITPRITELVRKGYIKNVGKYRESGLEDRRVNHYTLGDVTPEFSE